ncbi:uncharacterized protein LOC132744202 [Ruditapes philippinarum]|uniref:uncharacterized protein LOC132744202 n=1 Tax=Ruditapes philippinarum TaxID=129788 RepID=UPI00295BF5F2|nr:uncharacterized protein LOC132744202 [Ruditapes philippinarum]
MWRVRDFETPKVKVRNYSPTSMTAAYLKCREAGAPIRTTARQYGVPQATLRHKLSGRTNPEAVRSGPPPLFTQEEEALLVEHLMFTASVGYGYSRKEVIDISTEYAVALGHRQPGEPLSVGWFVLFKSRWPELKILAPRGLELQRAKATSQECVDRYYKELSHILVKYNLCDRPERLYNVDEKGLSTRHKPPPVVSGQVKSQAVVSASRDNVTVLGCGNAQGQQIPPYFVFPGVRMNSALLEGSTPGADGTVSESGWSNSEIFKHYLQSHLIKYFPERSESCPVVLFYDGHRSHINLNIVQWARQEHIILFILPAHTSHVLQPMDVGCFGPFEKNFKQ